MKITSLVLLLTVLSLAACCAPARPPASVPARRVLKTLDGGTVPVDELEAVIRQAMEKANVGAYELAAANTVLYVKVEDGKLHFSGDGQQWDQVYAESETRFFAPGDDTRVVFVKDAAGQVTGLNLEMQGLVLPARKVR